MVYESSHLPKDLKDRMYVWIKENLAAERKADQTDEQFIYSARKKALGPFKKDIMGLPQEIRDAISRDVEARFEYLFEKLNVKDTMALVRKHTSMKRVVSRRSRESEREVVLSHEGAD
jgi:hypothetical protein